MSTPRPARAGTSRVAEVAAARRPPAGPSDVVAARHRRPRPVRPQRPPLFWALLVGGLVLRVVLAVPGGGPVLADDGLGYLGNARWIAGVGEPSFVGSHQYSFGFSLLVAPFYALGLDGDGVVRAVQVLDAVLASAVALPLGAIVARAWPARAGRAPWIGLVASWAPALVLQPAFMWPESLLPLLFACWVVAVFRLHDGARGAAPALAALAVAVVVTHPRTIGVAVATGLVVGGEVVVRRWRGPRWSEVAGAAAVLVAGLLLARWFSSRLVAALWDGTVPTSADRAGSMVDRLRPDAWADVATAATGQLWYVAAGTFGLALLGLAVVAGRLRGAFRRGEAGRVAAALPWAGVLAAVAALAATSVLFTAGQRVDHVVYGRYNELWMPVVVALGLGWLAAAPPQARAVAAGAGAVAVVGLGLVLVAVLPPGRLEGEVMPLNVLGVAGLEALVRSGSEPFLPGLAVVPLSLLAAGAAALVAGLAVRWRAFLVGTGTTLLALSVWTHHDLVGPFRATWLDTLDVIVGEVDDDAGTLEYVLADLHPPTRNVLQFRLGDDRVRFVRSAARTRADLVVSSDAAALQRCHELVVTQPYGRQSLWRAVRPCPPRR